VLGLHLVFFCSGFAALLYQLVWQRALFGIYGINVESVTVVVTAFMLGLGFGSMAGGAVSKDPKRPVLLYFSLVELGIGLFGALSLELFRAVGTATLDLSAAGTAAATFALVLFPTMLMGGTLPLLVAHEVRASKNVGRSVGVLYFANTLGSAAAALGAVLFLFGRMGMAGTVRLACALNLAVAAGVFVMHLRHARREARAERDSPKPTRDSAADEPGAAPSMPEAT
jgi:predicted membrane-bound spermidine synthase